MAHQIHSGANSGGAISAAVWYDACRRVAEMLYEEVPQCYRSRSLSGILGDIRALSAEKSFSLVARKKGLGAQYAHQYLTRGVDEGRGYQVCAAEALRGLIDAGVFPLPEARVLDVGCAIGVTAGVLGLTRVTGFDLFIDLLSSARRIDSITGANHGYIAADMTRPWPFNRVFNTVLCGLVCHHLRTSRDTHVFFSSAARVLNSGGRFIATVPAGSIASCKEMQRFLACLECYGFVLDTGRSGLVCSTDSEHARFWMFIASATLTDTDAIEPREEDMPAIADLRAPIPRTVKGDRARRTAVSERQVHHRTFRFIPVTVLEREMRETPLIVDVVANLAARRLDGVTDYEI